ncbi:ROK family transcriptional regulator [Streptomyces sp. A73]|uniref:ROK family transcriptional regulator n=1 Tax=Streptomyces sp. RK75 TaxID=2824895 RepID=UPI000C1A17A5|nr:ROK family transcriptional regulator [Streptomyces sp. RK75]MBQ0865988.1 ROK family transcriptional regulator [Streptomyces sp. RK75]MBQ1162774.1 ROK family transcriptional regulator [Streptomyces sp. A73]
MATHTSPSGIPGTPGTPRVLRAMNDRAALDLLVAHGPLTRTRISELTGLSKPTASQLLGRLEETGLVRSRSKESGRPGPNALLYEIEPTAAHVAALSADPHGISAVVADITGTVVGRARVEADSVAEDVRHRTAQLVKEAVDGALREAGLGSTEPHTTVIGTPGAIDPRSGELRYAPHLPGWHSRTLRAELAEVLGTPVTIENDVNLAAMAEQHAGAAQDHDDFTLVWVDNGTGAAIVVGGVLLRGATGGAGEIGYMPLPGAPLARGGPGEYAAANAGGGFQSLVSVPAVRRLADGKPLAEALADLSVREETARRLANGIAAVVAVVDPQLVVLSGAVARTGGEELRALVERELTGLALPRPLLRLSEVADDPILGGALLSALAQARDEVFDTA